MPDQDYIHVIREAILLAKLPESVKVAEGWDYMITVNRQKSPGMVWKDRNVNIDFEKWPVVKLKRQPQGEWDAITARDKILFNTIEINVAAPTGMIQLGKAIELLLGV